MPHLAVRYQKTVIFAVTGKKHDAVILIIVCCYTAVAVPKNRERELFEPNSRMVDMYKFVSLGVIPFKFLQHLYIAKN